MNPRVRELRRQSLDTAPSISIERAVLLTDFYRDNLGRWPQPVLRAKAFHHLCAHKTIFIGDGELIVGERGHAPKATPTYPEISCHTVDDLHTLNDRPMTSYAVSDDDIETYQREVIPFWQGRSLREQMFAELPDRVARGLRGRGLHRVHGAARAGPHGGRRLDLPQGASRSQGRDRRRRCGPRLRIRPRRSGETRPARGHGHRRRCGHPLCRTPRRSSRGDGARRGRPGAPRRAASGSPRCAGASPPTRRATSGKRCRPTGSITSASSPNSTGGTPSTPATSTSTWRRSLQPGSPTAASIGSARKNCSNVCGSSSTTTPRRPRSG